VPAEHAANSLVYFADDNDGQSDTEYTDGETLLAKAAVQTGQGILPVDQALEGTLILVGRQNKPYPPGKIEINGEFYPDHSNALVGTDLTWVHRNRLQQLANLVSWFDDGTGVPEPGTTYEVKIFGETDNLIKTLTGINGTLYSLTSFTELAETSLRTLVTDRLLISSGLGIDTTSNLYAGIADKTFPPIPQSGFRRMGADWAIIGPAVGIARFVNGTTGATNSPTIVANTWRLDNTIADPFEARSDAVYILPTQVGQQTNWAIISSFTANPADTLRATDTATESIDDQREVAANHLTLTTRESSLDFVADGRASRKAIFYTEIRVHIVQRATLESGSTFTTIPVEVESYISAESNVLADATQQVLTIPDVEAPYATLSSTSARPPWRGVAMGSMLYVTYKGFGGTPFNAFDSEAQILDLSEIAINRLASGGVPASPLRAVYSSLKVKTKRFTIAANGLTTLSTIDDFVRAHRSNVADTEGIEWEVQSSSFRFVNTLTGATISTVAYSGGTIDAMAVDWVNSHIFIVRTSDLRILRLDYAGVEQENVIYPIPSPSRGPFAIDLKVSTSKVYLFTNNGSDVYSFNKDLTGETNTQLEHARLVDTAVHPYAAVIRPDSAVIYNYNDLSQNELYNEAGGQSPSTPTAKPRQNTSIKVELKSTRGGDENYQTFEHTFQRSGYGYNYGNFYGD